MAHKAPRRSPKLEDYDIPWDGVSQETYLASLEEVLSWVDQALDAVEIRMLMKEVHHLCKRFVVKFFHTKQHLAKCHLDTFEEKCKARSDELAKLFANLSKVGSSVELVILSGDHGTTPQKLRYFCNNETVFALGEDDDDLVEVYTQTQHPRCYSPLFVAILKIMNVAMSFTNISSKDKASCMYLSQIVLSLSRIYLEFRPNSETKRRYERKSLSQLSEPMINRSSRKLVDQLFEQVKNDIKEGTLPYVQEFCNALRATEEIRSSKFSFEDYYFSGKATASRCKGHKGAKSFEAQAYEIDNWSTHPIDAVIGYESAYNTIPLVGYSDPIIKTLAINQHKLKPRIIHVGNNPTQDRGNYLHNRLQSFLRQLPTDCTLDQQRGVIFALQQTSPNFRRKHHNGVYCLDFSNATDLLSQEFQCSCLGLLFAPEIVDWWRDVSQSTKEFQFSSGEKVKYIQATGQPQGLLGSFDSFALAHHIIMLMCMRACGLKHRTSSEFYRILGDDSIISSISSDKDHRVLKVYMRICIWANLEINLGKSHLTYPDDSVALAEFAKVTVLDGRIFSPPPIRILSRISAGTTNYYSFTTAIWMLKHGFNMPKLLPTLLEGWYGYDPLVRERAEALLCGGLIPQFAGFQTQRGVRSKERHKVALAYLIVKMRGSFVECLMPDSMREELNLHQFSVKDTLASLLPKNPEKLLDIIENPQHKLLQALQKFKNLEESLRVIIGEENFSPSYAALLDLRESEWGAIYAIADLYRLAKDNLLDDYMAPMIIGTAKSLESLDRFQQRSFAKHSVRELSYFDEILDLTSELFPEILEGDDADLLTS